MRGRYISHVDHAHFADAIAARRTTQRSRAALLGRARASAAQRRAGATASRDASCARPRSAGERGARSAAAARRGTRRRRDARREARGERPTHSPIEQTLLSIMPHASAMRRTTSSVMSQPRRALGHATQKPPAGMHAGGDVGKPALEIGDAVDEQHDDVDRREPQIVRDAHVVAALRRRTNAPGALSRHTLCPALIPSFFGSGVPA